MEFLEGTKGIYRPIKVLFDTPIYDRALQICWHISSFQVQIALMVELFKLQQRNQIPSQVSAEDMITLILEKSKCTLRERLWLFELEDFDAEEAQPLLKLVWAVNVTNKMREVEFEAQMLLDSPEAAPTSFQHPKVLRTAQDYAKILRDQEAPSSKQLTPQEVVLEVVPRVLHGLWILPRQPILTMMSHRLSIMSVGVTKAVLDRISEALTSVGAQVTLSRSMRDDMVQYILEQIEQTHPQEILVKWIAAFEPVLLSEIVDAAVQKICAMFQPKSTEEPDPSRPNVHCPATTPVPEEFNLAGAEDQEKPVTESPTAVVSRTPLPSPTPPAAPLTTVQPREGIVEEPDLNKDTYPEEEQPPQDPAAPIPTAVSLSNEIQSRVEVSEGLSAKNEREPEEPQSAVDLPPATSPTGPLTTVQPGNDMTQEPGTTKDPEPVSTSMEFLEGTKGIYRPIKVLFNTPIYDRALQICWHIQSFQIQIALMVELLKLRQRNQIPSQVSAEDMITLILEKSKCTLRERLWLFELEDFDAEEAQPLLKLVWAVNVTNKMREVEFEAQMLLDSPEAAPTSFQHPKVLRTAQDYAKILRDQEAPSSKQLTPQEVVLEVVPRVLHGLWILPRQPILTMMSHRLSIMSVGVTKAVLDRISEALTSVGAQVTLSRSMRDDMVQYILEQIEQTHPQEILVKWITAFEPVLLSEIVDVAVQKICAIFQPKSTEEPDPSRPNVHCPATTPVPEEFNLAGAEDQEKPVTESPTAVVSPTPLPSPTPPAAPLTTVQPREGIVEEPDLNKDTYPEEEQPPQDPAAPIPPAVSLSNEIQSRVEVSDELSAKNGPEPEEPQSAVDPPPCSNDVNQKPGPTKDPEHVRVEPLQDPASPILPGVSQSMNIQPRTEVSEGLIAKNGREPEEPESAVDPAPATSPTGPLTMVQPGNDMTQEPGPTKDPELVGAEPTQDLAAPKPLAELLTVQSRVDISHELIPKNNSEHENQASSTSPAASPSDNIHPSEDIRERLSLEKVKEPQEPESRPAPLPSPAKILSLTQPPECLKDSPSLVLDLEPARDQPSVSVGVDSDVRTKKKSSMSFFHRLLKSLCCWRCSVADD